MASEKFFDFLFDAFSNMEKVMADDASIYVFHADTEGLNFRRHLTQRASTFPGAASGRSRAWFSEGAVSMDHEPCLFGWKKSGKHQWYSDRKQTTVWEFEKSKKNTDHPTMKPIPLLSYPIANSSMSNTIVLDPFGGSGSTLIACEQMDRSCYTIELDEKYCDVIVRRYIEFRGSSEGVTVLRDGAELKYKDVEVSDE
jgi:DNA modification methylase